MTDNTNFFALEQRIMFDGAMAADVAENTTDTDPAAQGAENDQPQTKQVILVSNAVNDHEDLAKAAKDNVLAITYDADGSLQDILNSLQEALNGEKADSIALASHGGPEDGSFYIAGQLVSLATLMTDSTQQAFFRDLGTMIKEGGRLDILACDFTGSEQGNTAHALLQDLVGREVAASTDATGNEQYGGDWELETGHVDVNQYFDTTRLSEFDGLLIPGYEKLKDLTNDHRGIKIDQVPVRLGNSVIMFLYSDLVGVQLWITDGTVDGTKLLKDINPAQGPFYTGEMTVIGDKLYFAAGREDDVYDVEPWVTDGTEAGTIFLKNTVAEDANGPEHFTEHNGKVYFVSGQKIWVTDGTPDNTVAVWSSNNNIKGIASIGNVLRIVTSTSISDYDPVTDSATNRYYGNGDTNYNPVKLGENLIFLSVDTSPKIASIKSMAPDGTVTDLKRLGYSGWDGELAMTRTVVFGDKMLFLRKAPDGKTQVWTTDGTAAGTIQLKEGIWATANKSGGHPLGQVLNGKVVFVATDGTNDRQIWISDGTEAGTEKLLDINHTTDEYEYHSRKEFDASNFVVSDNKIYFNLKTSANGSELWESDGTAAGTKIYKDQEPGSGSSFAHPLGGINGELIVLLYGDDFAGTSGIYRAYDIPNAPPTLELSAGQTIYTITKSVTPVDENATLSDPQGNSDWNGGSLKAQISQNSESDDRLSIISNDQVSVEQEFPGSPINVFYSSTVIGTISGSSIAYGSNTLTISFNENATNEGVQAVMRSIGYANYGNTPDTSKTRTISITATDTYGSETVKTRSAVLNNLPQISVADTPKLVTIGQDTTQIDAAATLSDLDAGNAWAGGKLKIQITSGAESSDLISVMTDLPDSNLSTQSIGESTYVRDSSNEFATIELPVPYSDGDGEMVITFHENATNEQVQNLLRAIGYKNSATTPETFARTVTFTVIDKNGGEQVDTRQIRINSAPALSVADASTAVTNGATAILVDASATLNDADGNTDWDGGKLKFQITSGGNASDTLSILGGGVISVDGTDLKSEGAVIGQIDVPGGSVTGSNAITITFNANATNASVQETLRSIGLKHDGDANDTANRVVTVTATDKHGNAKSDSRTVNINFTPTLTVSADKLLSTSNGDKINVAAGSTLSDPEGDADWIGGTLKIDISANGSANDTLSYSPPGFPLHNRIQGSQLIWQGTHVADVNIQYFTGGGIKSYTFTFNDQATESIVQSILQSVTYKNTSDPSDQNDRTITITATDKDGGKETATRQIELNKIPSMGIQESPLTFHVGDTAIQIDSTATASEADGNADWKNGQLKIQITSNGQSYNSLSILSNVVGTISVDGNNLMSDTTIIGTFDTNGSTTSGTTPITITFNENATSALVQDTVRAIAFNHTSTDLNDSQSRQVQISLSDQHGIKNTKTRTIEVNHKPKLSVDTDKVTIENGNGADNITPNPVITDLDDISDWTNGTLTIQITQNATVGDAIKFNTYSGIRIDGTSLYAGSTLIGSFEKPANDAAHSGVYKFTFNQSASDTDVQNALSALQFEAMAQTSDANTATRQITITATDSKGGSQTVTRDVEVNIIPEGSGQRGNNTVLTADNSPVQIHRDIIITDPDATQPGSYKDVVLNINLSNAIADKDYLTIANKLVGDIHAVGNNLYSGPVIIGTLSVANGDPYDPLGYKITFNENATATTVQQAVRSVMFQRDDNSGNSPNIWFWTRFTDSERGEWSSYVNATVNNRPDIDPSTTDEEYIAGRPAFRIDPLIDISDKNGIGDFKNGLLTVQSTGFSEEGDILTLSPDMLGDEYTVTRSFLKYNGSTIAVLMSDSAKVSGEGKIEILFQSRATLQNVNDIARAFTFETFDGGSTPGDRTITFTMQDKHGAVQSVEITLDVLAPPRAAPPRADGPAIDKSFDAPVPVTRDPVNLVQGPGDNIAFDGLATDGERTFVSETARLNPLGSDGTRTFLNAPSIDSLGSDGLRTFIRAPQADAGPTAGAGVANANFGGDGAGGSQGFGNGGFNAFNGLGNGLGGDNGAGNGATFTPAGDVGLPADTLGPDSDLLETTPQEGGEITPAGELQSSIVPVGRQGFSAQIANAGSAGILQRASNLLAAHEQILKIKSA